MHRGALSLLVSGLAAGLAPLASAQQVQQSRPPEVTDSAVARGREVFVGPANCEACHGQDARGGPKGPDLTDAFWIRGRGTYSEILERVAHGVPRRQSHTGEAMPMRGWSPASDDDVRAVAAYVWSLSHSGKGRRP